MKLDDVVYVHFGTASAATGAATDADAIPTVSVEEDGVALGYAPTVATVTTGLYRVTIACSTGNGFEAGKRYSAYARATVGGITGRDSIVEFGVDTNGLDDVPGGVWAVTGPLAKTYGLMAAENNAAQIIRVGQFQAGSTTQNVVLDAGASTTNDFYNRCTLTVATGVAGYQNRLINDYDGATRTASLDRPLRSAAPGAGDFFAIDSRGNTRSATDSIIGVAQAGGASTITLQSGSDVNNDFYNRMTILIESGTGEGQSRLIDDYDGGTLVATVARAWVTQPDATSRYVILPTGSVKVAEMDPEAVSDILDTATEGAYTIRGLLRLMASALAAKVSGGGTATLIFRDINDTKDRITATVDVNGNRTAVTLDAT